MGSVSPFSDERLETRVGSTVSGRAAPKFSGEPHYDLNVSPLPSWRKVQANATPIDVSFIQATRQ
jgi:hypothetical protein